MQLRSIGHRLLAGPAAILTVIQRMKWTRENDEERQLVQGN